MKKLLESAAIPLAGLTAYQGLVQQTGGKEFVSGPDKTLLILGGSGGVGHLAVQMGKILGANVIATTSAKNAEYVTSLGADQVIDYTSTKWEEVLAGQKVDLVFDTVGDKDGWARAQTILKDGGHFLTIASQMAPQKTEKHSGKFFLTISSQYEDLEVLKGWVEEGKLKVTIAQVFDFNEAGVQGLYNGIHSGKTRGKLLLNLKSQ